MIFPNACTVWEIISKKLPRNIDFYYYGNIIRFQWIFLIKNISWVNKWKSSHSEGSPFIESSFSVLNAFN